MSSPSYYHDYSPPGSQDRSDREIPSDDHKFKRRRLEGDSSPQGNMANASRPPNIPVSTSASHYPHVYGPPGESFTHMPMNAGALWEEDAALEYLASGTGFAQDLRTVVPPLPYTYNLQSLAMGSRPPRLPELTSHPAHPPSRQHQTIPSGFRPLPDDFFQHVQLGSFSDERLREFAGHMTNSARYMMASQISRNAFFSHDQNRTPPIPNQGTNENLLRRRSPPTVGPSGRPTVMLILSRATSESIEALDEHKRECPACQLEFEPDNFMAVITCCDTAMHATCLSAWVNSGTYNKSRTCMKCRRGIDARRVLNNVVPPVSDKNWDEVAEFNAPESLKGDAKIELNVSARPDRASYRRMRESYYSNFRARQPALPLPDQVSADGRRAIARLRQEQMVESDEMRHRVRAAFAESNKAFEDDDIANRTLNEARDEVHRGVSIDLGPLIRRCEETKLAKEKANEAYRKAHNDSEALQRSHSQRLAIVIDGALAGRYGLPRPTGDELARSISPSGEGNATGSALSGSP
ncbi:uncharacterized protein Z518_05025 [Rhinocladiella mackenziei CBS 650.93]|uniref:RING-type domain-containing protein n=1 Tax=Rhinocladiella mackenziei CBS 650.93 TaxID=1442369 RepID=A0A0D2H996_9EURO|nr:uncharacterized protein Z518_05025 [Rhinocladiella mackenziei CBS 650.93]KIX07048.1 hypothetical protein Z518_05025 [Rhinocladiella mackenziei CBS 650.93]